MKSESCFSFAMASQPFQHGFRDSITSENEIQNQKENEKTDIALSQRNMQNFPPQAFSGQPSLKT